MSPRLVDAFAALGERGTPAGAEAVWQRAVLAAGGDEAPLGGPGADGVSPLVAVQAPAPRRGGGRVLVVVGLASAAAVAAVTSAIVLRDERPSVIGGPSPADTSAPDPSFAPTTAGITDTTAAVPGTTVAVEPLPDQPWRACSTDAPLTETTAAVGVGDTTIAPAGPCADAAGTLPPAAPGADDVDSAVTVVDSMPISYLRMADDLEIGWRMEDGVSLLYWRTPAGSGRSADDFFGSKGLVSPTADGYLVLARPLPGTAADAEPSMSVTLVVDGDQELGPVEVEYPVEGFLVGVARFDTTAVAVDAVVE